MIETGDDKRSPTVIQTLRLNLIPLSREDLAAGLVSLDELSRRLDLVLVHDLFSGKARSAVEKKVVKMEGIQIELVPWFTYWLIYLREESIGVGLVGYKGAPNSNGEVEIGYGIDLNFQRQGYMTEAVKAMTQWAFNEPSCRIITAILSAPNNIASHRVLEKSGFQKVYSGPDGFSYRLERPQFTN
jgi:ribosomal-protein-alanine N-acetyltransferase